MDSKKDILVFADWQETGHPRLMGLLGALSSRGDEVFSFSYDNEWLQTEFAQTLDPDLLLYEGPQYPAANKQIFGLFLDSSPDRWGRLIMRRREAALARQENRKPEKLRESDYLLGVHDRYRMGGLRFKTDLNEDFLDNSKDFAAPPWTSLRELEQASGIIENESEMDDDEENKWLNMLLAPGSSLGGARPKASVMAPDQTLWIAKFPSHKDEIDAGAWEMIIHDLAIDAGINMAQGTTDRFVSSRRTYLTKRFDRTDDGKRIHFASAMTLLGYMDGDDHETGVSYLELAEFIMRFGAQAERDLKELWRRIVFYIYVSNTDDHLRNHGFLLTPTGWMLSPAYDINPNPHASGLTMNISEDENSLDIELALSVAEYFYITLKEAKAIVSEVKKAVCHWKSTAIKYGTSRAEQTQMEHTFVLASDECNSLHYS